MISDYHLFQKINQFAGQWKWSDWFGIFSAQYLIWLMLAGVIFYFLFFIKSEWCKKIKCFLKLILASGLVYVINWLIGLIYFRPRPFVSHPDIFQLIQKSPLDKSFPSDHTALAFVLAFSVFCYNKKRGTIFLIIAALIGLARVFAGVHYPLDVLAGALVGWLAVRIIQKTVKS